MVTKKQLDTLTYEVVGAAIEVHKAMGPGLLGTVYHECIREELRQREISFQTELVVPVLYKGLSLNADLRCDLFVEKCLAVEIKAVQEIHPVFESQLLTYTNLLEASKGILINFFCKNLFRDGQKTFVNDFFRGLPDE